MLSGLRKTQNLSACISARFATAGTSQHRWIKMKVKRLTETAKLPTKANPGDSCFDLYSDESVQTRFGEITEIKTGIAIEFPAGIGGVIKPRSGLSRDHGLIILGGEIDSGYRGEIIVLMGYVKQYHQTFIGKGQKIAQLRLVHVIDVDIEETTEPFLQTVRGGKGFGSSGA